MKIIGLDELNVLRSMPYKTFFGEMEISEEKKKRLIEIAEKFEEDYLFFLIWMADEIEMERIDYSDIKKRFSIAWKKTASEYLFDEDFLNAYADKFADNAVESTLRHVDSEYYFSEDRARFNAENEALTIFNREEFLEAVENGFTMKKWISLLDGRERKTHGIADGQEVGIFDMFHVGAAKMLFPRDFLSAHMHPEETVGCRCFMTYR